MGEAGEDAAAQAYFRSIEETFIRLRGAPLLLSPADWQLAKGWMEQGIPLSLVQRTLEEVFERRRLRGARGKVQGLRYCRDAVEGAWKEIRDLSAVEQRTRAAPVDVAARLEQLAASLPSELTDRAVWRDRLTALEGEAERVEEELAELDRQMLESVWEGLPQEGRAEVEAAVERSLAPMSERLSEEEGELLRHKLRRQHLRRSRRLPVLSLFSPEAAAGSTE